MIYVITYLVISAFYHGYLRTVYKSGDDIPRFFSTIGWPLSMVWLWMFIPISNLSFSTLTNRAFRKVKKNRARLEEINKVRISVEQSKRELREAEEELEQELSERHDFAR